MANEIQSKQPDAVKYMMFLGIHPGRSKSWCKNLEKILTSIQKNSFFPDDIKLLAYNTGIAHKQYLLARTNFKLVSSKSGQTILATAFGLENVEAKINEAKNKFLSAEEKERTLVLELKKRFLSWYEQDVRKEMASKGLWEKAFDKKIDTIESLKMIFDDIDYINPKKHVSLEEDFNIRWRLTE